MANNLFSKAEILALKESIVGDVNSYAEQIEQNSKDISSLKGDLEQLNSDNNIAGNQISGSMTKVTEFTNYVLKENLIPVSSSGITYAYLDGYDSTTIIPLNELPDTITVPYQSNTAVPTVFATRVNGAGQVWNIYPTSFCSIDESTNTVIVNVKYLKDIGQWATLGFTYESGKMHITFDKQIVKKRLEWAYGNNILTVSKDENAEFNTIQSAIDYAKDGDIIYVFNGEYEEHLDMYHKNITLKGQSALNTIVFDTSLIYENSPIICGTGSIEDITFHNRKLENKDYSSITRYSYAMHLDQRWGNGNKKISIKNCVFINDFGSASIGCGVVDGCEIEIVNCRIYSNAKNGSGLQVHGDSTGNGNANIRISNSLLWGHGNGSGLLLSNGSPEYNTGTTITVHAHNNILYGFYNDIGDLFIKSETNYGNIAKKTTEIGELNN